MPTRCFSEFVLTTMSGSVSLKAGALMLAFVDHNNEVLPESTAEMSKKFAESAGTKRKGQMPSDDDIEAACRVVLMAEDVGVAEAALDVPSIRDIVTQAVAVGCFSKKRRLVKDARIVEVLMDQGFLSDEDGDDA